MKTVTREPGSQKSSTWAANAIPETTVEKAVLSLLAHYDCGLGVEVNFAKLAESAICAETTARAAVTALSKQGFISLYEIDGPGIGVLTKWHAV